MLSRHVLVRRRRFPGVPMLHIRPLTFGRIIAASPPVSPVPRGLVFRARAKNGMGMDMSYEQALNTSPEPIKLTVRDYLLLHEAGALSQYPKTELVNGAIVAMSPQHRRHGFAKEELRHRLRLALEALGSELYVWTEVSVDMSPVSMPQPDITVSTEAKGVGPITAGSVALIAEIADSTVDWDIGEKAAIYAEQGVPEYWVVDLQNEIVHRHIEPRADGYISVDTINLGQPLASVTLPSLEVATDNLI